jgi:hypothetical protein
VTVCAAPAAPGDSVFNRGRRQCWFILLDRPGGRDRGPGLDSLPEEVDMPRTDENGKQLKAVLNYFLDGDVQSSDLCQALEIATSTYYRRIKDADYPDAEELRKVAQKFGLSFLDLVVRFGLMSDEDVTREVQKYCARRQLEQVRPKHEM